MNVLDWITAGVAICGAAIALVTLIKGVIEYSKQGAQKRAEFFFEIRKRFKDNENFRELTTLIGPYASYKGLTKNPPL